MDLSVNLVTICENVMNLAGLTTYKFNKTVVDFIVLVFIIMPFSIHPYGIKHDD